MPQNKTDNTLESLRAIVAAGGPQTPVRASSRPTSTIGGLSPWDKYNEKVLPSGDEPLAQRGVFDALLGGSPRSDADWMQDAATMTGTLGPRPGLGSFKPKQPLPSARRMEELVSKFGGKAEALPMDEASRMARAAEQGYVHDVYHGTQYPNKKTFRNPIRDGSYGSGDFGIHVSGSPDTANKFSNRFGNISQELIDPLDNEILASERGGQVLPLKAKMGNTLELPDMGIWRDPMSYARLSDEYVTGHDNSAFLAQIREAAKQATDKQYKMMSKGHLDNLDNPWQHKLVELLQGEGYDSIKYINRAELGEKPSYLLLDPRQLRSKFAAFDPKNTNSKNLLASLAAAVGGSMAVSHEPEKP